MLKSYDSIRSYSCVPLQVETSTTGGRRSSVSDLMCASHQPLERRADVACSHGTQPVGRRPSCEGLRPAESTRLSRCHGCNYQSRATTPRGHPIHQGRRRPGAGVVDRLGTCVARDRSCATTVAHRTGETRVRTVSRSRAGPASLGCIWHIRRASRTWFAPCAD